MIVTFTANPSLDRTVALPGPLARGEVQRAVSVSQESGGKGVNVSRALVASGLESVAVLPGADSDPVLAGLRDSKVPFVSLPIDEPLRTNVALTEPGGVTTKINEPGPVLDENQQKRSSNCCSKAPALLAGWSLPAHCRRASPPISTPR